MESICYYEIYPPFEKKIQVTEADLKSNIEEYVAVVNHLLNGENFIFYNEPFNLEAKLDDGPPRIVGKTNCAISVDDEWFIVRILFFITECFDGTSAKIWDEDGLFMLFEVADVLPKWIEPETSENRIWIYDGQLHFLSGNKEKGKIMSIEKALEMLSNELIPTTATSKIQEMVKQRIDSCDRENFHKANIDIPAKLAFILQTYPNLIPVVVTAICNHTEDDVKVISKPFEYFPPTTNVKCSIKFSRLLYATVHNYNLNYPRGNGFDFTNTNAEYTVGMKMAMGAEIICARIHKMSGKDNIARPIEQTASFKHFLDKLNEFSYFEGQIKDSAIWKLRFEKAKEFYNSSITDAGDSRNRLLYDKCLEFKCKYEHMKRLELSKPDSIKWMIIDDKMMLSTFKSFNNSSLKTSGKAADAINDFINEQSEYDGIKINDNEQKSSKEKESESECEFKDIINDFRNILELEDSGGQYSSTDLDEMYDSDDINQMKNMMEGMDSELKSTTMAQSFVSADPTSDGAASNEQGTSGGGVVDIMANINEQLSRSLNLQAGTSGPVSTLLGNLKMEKD